MQGSRACEGSKDRSVSVERLASRVRQVQLVTKVMKELWGLKASRAMPATKEAVDQSASLGRRVSEERKDS